MSANDAKWSYKPVAVTLFLTALAKLYSSGGNAKILQTQDQLLHLGYRPLMILTALVEAAVAAFLLKSRSDLKRAVVLLWLSLNFIWYHLGNYLLGINYCPCLGQVADPLPLPHGMPNIMLQVLVLYWFVGSSSSLWRLWGSRQWRRLALAPRRLLRKRPAGGHP